MYFAYETLSGRISMIWVFENTLVNVLEYIICSFNGKEELFTVDVDTLKRYSVLL